MSTQPQSDPQPAELPIRTRLKRASQFVPPFVGGLPGPPDHRPAGRRVLPYIPSKYRAFISFAVAASWTAFAIWISQPWLEELQDTLGMVYGTIVVVGLAWIPGYLTTQLWVSLMLDRTPPLRDDVELPGVTVLMAAWNESATIRESIQHVVELEYPASLSIVIIDDGSTDDTADIAESYIRDEQLEHVTVLRVPHGGKSRALNTALLHVTTPLVATIDADTLPHPESLRRLVQRMVIHPEAVACAGSLLVRNTHDSVVSRMQIWDYMLSIAAIKRQQAMLQGTLVAQGAYSVYATHSVLGVGGWPEDVVGEDIVLTWQLLSAGATTTFEPTAFAWTVVPGRIRDLFRQRLRWGRGMVEGLRQEGPDMLRTKRVFAHSVATNFIFPIVDIAFTFGFIPGVFLAVFFQNYMIVGPMILLTIPMSAISFGTMRWRQSQAMHTVDLTPQVSKLGFIAYLFCYQMIVSPAALMGYLREMFHREKTW